MDGGELDGSGWSGVELALALPFFPSVWSVGRVGWFPAHIRLVNQVQDFIA